MRSLQRTLWCGAACALAFVGAHALTSPASTARAAAVATGFGGAVLVGDGEVFAGEAANQFRPGMVYVYRKSGTAWQESMTLTAPEARVGDRFGTALALDGNRLFVAAGTDTVHVFMKAESVWRHTSVIAATTVPMPPAAEAAPAVEGQGRGNSPAPNVARFGTAVAASGDWLLVGKEVAGGGRGRGGRGGRGSAAALPPGEVFAFKRDAGGQYAFHSRIVAADTAASAGDGFGAAIALHGTVALIGANGQNDRAGVVHEFGLDADGTWKSQRTFAPLGAQGNELFGADIQLIDAEQAVVAAPGDGGGYGAAYVFRKVAQGGRGRAGGQAPAAAPAGGNFTWAEVARLAAPAAGRTDGFATSIAADTREVWIGAPRAGGPGRVFVFPGNAMGFQIDGVKLLDPGTSDPAQAGVSISVRGNVAAVGALGANRGGGGVLIFERDAFGAWREQPMLTTAIDEIPAYTGSERRCSSQGKVEVFDCGATDLLAFLPPSRLTHDGHYVEMNDIWGWTDPQTKREWAIVGRRDGTTFVDITEPTRPIVAADLPLTDGARPSSWRDMKVYKDHAYIVSDSAGPHGMQVFDLTRLRTLQPQPNGLPQKVAFDGIYRNINSAHNIAINEESGYAYPIGASGGGTTCGGGLHMVDIRDPKNPTFAGCFADPRTGRAATGYSHDAQCVMYKGPDRRYRGREICVGSNENSISIADVTDKKNPKALSHATYPRVAYAHQGWFTEDQKFFFLDDEGDEGQGVPKTRTMIWDLTDLENPKLAKEHLGVEASSDHNLYIKGTLMYQANYKSGLRVLSIKDPLNPREVAYFDTAPFGDNSAGYQGAWSVYPYFKSGVIIVNSIEQGLFLVRTADR